MMKSIWKIPTVIMGILICSILSGIDVYGAEKEGEEKKFSYVDSWLASSDMSAIDKGMDEIFPDAGIDTGELLSMIMQGEVVEALKTLTGEIKSRLSGELGGLKQVFIYILVLGVFSALFTGFSDLFSGQQIAHAGFYFLYLLLMGLLTKVFGFASEIAVSTVENIVLFVKLFIPTYFTAVGAAQGAASAVYYYQIMLIIAYLVENCLVRVLIPFIYSYVMLALLNGLWAEEKLALLLEFIEKGIVLALKVAMGAVTGLSLVQAVILPVVSGLKISAMRKAVSAIPGLGGVAEGVTELMLGSAVLIRNSMGVLLLILILGACALPVLKILIVTGTVKLGAAVAGIVSDKRIAACADRVGIGCFLLLRCVFTGVALFIIVIAVISYTLSS
ncbi:MAG: stage III sporulation protein AE [Firmicutes bacterium]|nr:stage III sporulation protein AE [Bacillota bacterium]